MQVDAGAKRIEVDVQGPAGGPVLLLLMGLGMQLTNWPQALVDLLTAQGLRVLRMDNRDAGLSQGCEHAGVPNIAWAGFRYGLRMRLRPVYTLGEMALDVLGVLGVLDALRIPRAHVCGASMGGMIAQHLAVRAPQRVASLTLMMSSTGARELPQPAMQVRMALLSRPAGPGRDAIVSHLERIADVVGSPGFRPDLLARRKRLQAQVERAWRPDGTARQILAVMADGDRSALLPGLAMPVALIHGQDDPLVPVAAAYQLASLLPGAMADIIPGMGHDLPDALLPRFAQTMVANVQRTGRPV